MTKKLQKLQRMLETILGKRESSKIYSKIWKKGRRKIPKEKNGICPFVLSCVSVAKQSIKGNDVQLMNFINFNLALFWLYLMVNAVLSFFLFK